MAELNPNIPLGFQFPQLPTAQSVEQLKQMQYRNQLAQMQMQQAQAEGQQAQQQAQSRNAMMDLFKRPGAVDEKGMPTQATVGKVMQIDPDAGLKLQNNLAAFEEKRQSAMTQQINQRLLGLKISDAQHDVLTDIGASAQDRYETLVANGTNTTEAARIAGQERNKAIQDAQKSGRLLPEQAGQLQGPFNPETNKAFVASSPQYKTILSERSQVAQDKLAADREKRLAKEGESTGGQKAPSGYKYNASGNLEFIPGGPADPVTREGKLGAREAVFINRTMLSANEAAKDLENVVKLPISSSTGWFGGRQQGTTLMGAGKEVLANKMTPQEVQSYNVRSAGFQRSLAAIEAAGLAPSGSLSHQMDAIIFKEGDTNLTKLQKLAQTRQIIEAGLETTLSNPKLPESQTKHIEDVLKSIKKSVPFTISDIDNLTEAQDKNPKATLSRIMKKMGNTSGDDTKSVNVNGKKMDAKRAPDGKYYVKMPSGKYAEVM